MEIENPKHIHGEGTEPNRERITLPTGQRERNAPPVKRRGRKTGWFLLLALLAVGATAGFMFEKFFHAPSKAAEQAIPIVAVTKVVREDLYNEVSIPAEFRAYVQSELHAMVTGYVSRMNVDFGDKVKQGEVLATLEVPELNDELRNAQAKQQQLEADYENAHIIYTRLLKVSKERPTLVAQQEIDTTQAKDSSSASAVAAAKAEVQKYQTLVNYTKIIAPFDGVITKRSVDPGALVQAGTSSDRSMPLLRVSDNYHLRLDFPVSVDYVRFVQMGESVTVRVDSLGGKTYTGKITRFTNLVNDQTRTMITELLVDNPDLEIVPGMYAAALFKFKQKSRTLSVPTQAVNKPKDPVVYVVNASNEIEVRHVKLGVETPYEYEITDGLKEGEVVMVGHASHVNAGQKVEPKMTELQTMQ